MKSDLSRLLHRLWQTIILFIIFLVIIDDPLVYIFRIPLQGWLFKINVLVTIFFTLDIFINLWKNKKTAETDNHLTEGGFFSFRQKTVFLFITDAIAAIPFEMLITLFIEIDSYELHLLFLFRFFKIFRIVQFMDDLRQLNFINPSILRLSFLVFWITVAAHFIACGWVLLYHYPAGMDDFTKYLRALYWTVTTLTTIGYGDITPSNNNQTIYVIIIEIIGAGMYGFIIANIATLIANIDVAKASHREKVERINVFMRHHSIPPDMVRKVNGYYSYLWQIKHGYDDNNVLSDLPYSLQSQISLYLNQEIIEKVPFFKGASADLLRSLIIKMQPVIFTPGDFIFHYGDMGLDMFFISKGMVEVISEDEQTVYAHLGDGQFFGEMALLLSQPRAASVRASTYCDLYRLDKDTFDRVVRLYPEFAMHIRTLMEERSGAKPS